MKKHKNIASPMVFIVAILLILLAFLTFGPLSIVPGEGLWQRFIFTSDLNGNELKTSVTLIALDSDTQLEDKGYNTITYYYIDGEYRGRHYLSGNEDNWMPTIEKTWDISGLEEGRHTITFKNYVQPWKQSTATGTYIFEDKVYRNLDNGIPNTPITAESRNIREVDRLFVLDMWDANTKQDGYDLLVSKNIALMKNRFTQCTTRCSLFGFVPEVWIPQPEYFDEISSSTFVVQKEFYIPIEGTETPTTEDVEAVPSNNQDEIIIIERQGEKSFIDRIIEWIKGIF